jgi:hypothetical protein
MIVGHWLLVVAKDMPLYFERIKDLKIVEFFLIHTHKHIIFHLAVKPDL